MFSKRTIISSTYGQRYALHTQLTIESNYTVDRHGVCYRTEIALAGTVLDGKVFAEYLMSHELDYNSETLVQRSLKSFYDQLEYGYSQGLAACQTSRLAGPQKEMAERRWQECVELLKLANKSLG